LNANGEQYPTFDIALQAIQSIAKSDYQVGLRSFEEIDSYDSKSDKPLPKLLKLRNTDEKTDHSHTISPSNCIMFSRCISFVSIGQLVTNCEKFL
jgi:hypothetical protein